MTLFSAIVATSPHFSLAHYNLAIAYERNRDYAGALEAYRRAGTLRPPMPEVPASIARVQSLLGEGR